MPISKQRHNKQARAAGQGRDTQKQFQAAQAKGMRILKENFGGLLCINGPPSISNFKKHHLCCGGTTFPLATRGNTRLAHL